MIFKRRKKIIKREENEKWETKVTIFKKVKSEKSGK
jgi:hypothetical protein